MVSVGAALSKPFVSHSLFTSARKASTLAKRVSILFSFTPASERPWRSRLRDSSSVRLEYTAVCSGSCWLSAFVAAQPQKPLRVRFAVSNRVAYFFKFMRIYLPYNGFIMDSGGAYFFQGVSQECAGRNVARLTQTG